MEARWADASRVEGIPFVSARAEPFVFFTGRPAAERAPDARRLRLAGLVVFLKLAIWGDDRVVSNGTHACRSR